MGNVDQEHIGIEPVTRETLVHSERDLLGTSWGLVYVHLGVARGDKYLCKKKFQVCQYKITSEMCEKNKRHQTS